MYAPIMKIEIHDRDLEARIQKQIQATGSGSVEEALTRLLDTQEEQDLWLLENRAAINAKIRRGIEQLDRGEGIPEEQLTLIWPNSNPSLNDSPLRPRSRGRARSGTNLAVH